MLNFLHVFMIGVGLVIGLALLVATVETHAPVWGMRWLMKGSALFITASFAAHMLLGADIWTAAERSLTAYLWLIGAAIVGALFFLSFGGHLDDTTAPVDVLPLHDSGHADGPDVLPADVDRVGPSNVCGILEPDPAGGPPGEWDTN